MSNSSESETSAAKALNVLLCFDYDHPELSLTEIASRLTLPKSTVHRLLQEMEKKSFIEQSEVNKKYSLGLKLYELGYIYDKTKGLRHLALPSMESLRNETRGTVILSQLKDDQIVIIESLPGTEPIKITFKPGQRNHFNFGAAGAVLCAFMNQNHLEQLVAQKGLYKFTNMTVSNEETFFQHLSEVRANEIAISDEEAIKGARAIAVPIYQRGDKVIAALSIAFPSVNCTRKQLFELSDVLKGAARAISSRLGEMKIT